MIGQINKIFFNQFNNCVVLLVISLMGTSIFSQPKLPAFPGAEGAGAFASGGRGGEVYVVNNLNADGPGSLQDAVRKPNRFVIFAVSGVIDLLQKDEPRIKSNEEIKESVEERIKEINETAEKEGRDESWIKKKVDRANNKSELDKKKEEVASVTGGYIYIGQPNITIAGQTAPGEGITLIHGTLVVKASNVIIRHIRVRRGFIGEGQNGDGISVKGGDKTLHDIIIDHCSSAWTTDENITMTSNITNCTLQYSIAAEGCDYFNFGQTPPRHSEGSLFGTTVPGGIVSFHHIIYSNNRLRNPRVTGGNVKPLSIHDLRNCVISNWVENSSHTGSGGAGLNLVNNYYKPGVDTWERKRNEIFEFKQTRGAMYAYISGNYLYDNEEVNLDNWKGTRDSKGEQPVFNEYNIADNEKNITHKMDKPFEVPFVTTQTALEAYETCLDNAGATIPSRDYVDFRITRDIRYGAGRVIDTENDLPENERWPDVWTLPAPEDSDKDGMPDYWEKQFNLDSNSNDSMNDKDGDGYTNIEEYVNSTNPVGSSTSMLYVSTPVSRSIKYEDFNGKINITRVGETSSEMNVEYSVSGTAIYDKDYKELSGNIVIPKGEESVIIDIVPLLKGKVEMGSKEAEEDKSVVIEISEKDDYKIGCPRSAMVVIKEH